MKSRVAILAVFLSFVTSTSTTVTAQAPPAGIGIVREEVVFAKSVRAIERKKSFEEFAQPFVQERDQLRALIAKVEKESAAPNVPPKDLAFQRELLARYKEDLVRVNLSHWLKKQIEQSSVREALRPELKRAATQIAKEKGLKMVVAPDSLYVAEGYAPAGVDITDAVIARMDENNRRDREKIEKLKNESKK